jgi:hypothetical protein
MFEWSKLVKGKGHNRRLKTVLFSREYRYRTEGVKRSAAPLFHVHYENRNRYVFRNGYVNHLGDWRKNPPWSKENTLYLGWTGWDNIFHRHPYPTLLYPSDCDVRYSPAQWHIPKHIRTERHTLVVVDNIHITLTLGSYLLIIKNGFITLPTLLIFSYPFMPI